jgi:hypothetical protein
MAASLRERLDDFQASLRTALAATDPETLDVDGFATLYVPILERAIPAPEEMLDVLAASVADPEPPNDIFMLSPTQEWRFVASGLDATERARIEDAGYDSGSGWEEAYLASLPVDARAPDWLAAARRYPEQFTTVTQQPDVGHGLEAVFKERFFLKQHATSVSVLRELGLARPLFEHVDDYTEAARMAVTDLETMPRSREEVRRATAAVDLERYLPQTHLESLLSVGMTNWFWVAADESPLGSASLPASALGPDAEHLKEWRRLREPNWDYPAQPLDVRDYVQAVYAVDTWADVCLSRPDLIALISGRPAGETMREMVRDTFVRRQVPGVEKLIWDEVQELRNRVTGLDQAPAQAEASSASPSLSLLDD